MSNHKWNNKPVPVDTATDSINIVDENIITSVQTAALNETTERSTSKPKAAIDGQTATGGGGSATPHTLGTAPDTQTGPWISQHAANFNVFETLYDNNTAYFNGKTINGIKIENKPGWDQTPKTGETAKECFTNIVLGGEVNEQLDISCIYAPNVTDAAAAGVWTWSEQVMYTPGVSMGFFNFPPKFTDKWFIPEGLFLYIMGLEFQPNDPTTYTMNQYKAISEADRKILMNTRKDLLDPLLSTSGQQKGKHTLNKLNAAVDGTMGGSVKIPRIHGSTGTPTEFDTNSPDNWWSTLEEYIFKMTNPSNDVRVNPHDKLAGGPHCSGLDATDRANGWKVGSSTSTTHASPMTVADDKIEVNSSVLDVDDLPNKPSQFEIDVPWDADLLSNLKVLFADPADYAMLDGQTIKVDVLKDSVSTVAGADAPPSIRTYSDRRPEELDNNGLPEHNQYDEESVVPAINRIHAKTNQAISSAVGLDQFLTQKVIGNPNSSAPSAAGDVIFDALSAAGYDATTTIALGRLNLIPILSGDRLVEVIPKVDPTTGEKVYNDLGTLQVVPITQEQRAEMTPQARQDRFMLHPDSDVPPTSMLEALWTNWRHLSALTTDTYGISALTDVDIIDDKHELIEPLELNSFIQNFNLLYNMTDSLSANLGPIKRALSGEAPGDTLIAELSAYSVYHNLNTIYTGMSANSACCETNTLSTFNNRTDIDLLSAFAIDIDNRLGQGGGGGITVCEGQDICSVLTNLHDTIVNLDDPGGFTIDHPAGFPKNFKPDRVWEPVDANDPCIGTVNPDSDVYRYYDKQEGQPEQEIFLWQHVDNSWYIGDVCDMANGQQIANPLNLPLSALSHNNKQIIKIDSPYKEFTEKINRVIEYVDNPPIVRNPVGRKDPVDIDALSACCDTNTLSLSALSAYVGGPVTNLHNNLIQYGDITNVVNKLYQDIQNLEEAGVPQEVINLITNNTLNININRSNITTLSGDLSALEMNVDILSGNVTTNTTRIDQNTQNIQLIDDSVTILSGDVENLKECCDDSVKLDDLGMHAVLLTGAQSISGEKLFKDTLTVETTAVIGENVTVGEGDTVFSVCADENGMNHVMLHEIIVDPADMSVLPDGAIFALEVTDPRDGVGLIKQLYVK